MKRTTDGWIPVLSQPTLIRIISTLVDLFSKARKGKSQQLGPAVGKGRDGHKKPDTLLGSPFQRPERTQITGTSQHWITTSLSG